MDHQTPNDLLPDFYSKYNLGKDGGVAYPYVIIEFFKYLKVYIPNWDARRRGVLKHDIHHILTGYESIMTGEFQIAAWEIASGCIYCPSAYLLNAGGLVMGLFLYTKKTFQAFMRGCDSISLYRWDISDEDMKSMSISELKKMIRLKESHESHIRFFDILKLILHFILSSAVMVLTIFSIPYLIVYNMYWYGKNILKR